MEEDNEEPKSVCVVCMESCDHDGIRVKCGHYFHENCLLEWVLQDPEQCRELTKYIGTTAALRGSCPVCRSEIPHVFNVKPAPQANCCVIS